MSPEAEPETDRAGAYLSSMDSSSVFLPIPTHSPTEPTPPPPPPPIRELGRSTLSETSVGNSDGGLLLLPSTFTHSMRPVTAAAARRRDVGRNMKAASVGNQQSRLNARDFPLRFYSTASDTATAIVAHGKREQRQQQQRRWRRRGRRNNQISGMLAHISSVHSFDLHRIKCFIQNSLHPRCKGDDKLERLDSREQMAFSNIYLSLAQAA